MDRHPSQSDLLRFFTFDHLPEGAMRSTSKQCADLAHNMMGDPRLDGAELTAGLRKLLEAKDCFVRAALR